MLQFVIGVSEQYTVAEQAQMAIEGGAKWVIFNPGDLSDGEIREVLAELVPLCRETETILTVIDHPEVAREMKIHGVELSTATRAATVREELGPEAIIGVAVGGAEGIESLRGKDIDYFVLPSDCERGKMADIVARVRTAGDPTAIVARGVDDIAMLGVVMSTGVSGVQVSSVIFSAPDPVEATHLAIKEITG